MRRFFFTLALIFPIFSLYAQIFPKENFHLSVEPTFSYSSGVLNEVIYHSADTSKRISLLEWERKLWMYGVNVSGNYKNFHFKTRAETSIPAKSGEMRDSDWLNGADYSMKTTYSVGTNYADTNFDSTASVFYDFEIGNGFFILPEIQVQYSFDSFYRKKGSRGWYGQSEWSSDGKNHWWYDDEATKFPSVNPETGKTRKLAGIDYDRHSFYAWLGLGTAFRAGRFYAGLSFLISPFTYFSAEDRHHTGGDDNVYHHIQQDFFTSYKANLFLSYEISRYFDLTLDGSFLFASEIIGDLYIRWHKNTSQPSGASSNGASVRIGCRVKVL